MRNIPMFATDLGVASLVLEEIPYKKEAYISIRSTERPKEFLDECVAFCRAAGAERVYAGGHDFLEAYPLHTSIYEMECATDLLPCTDAVATCVDEGGLASWIEIYNNKMANVPNSATMTFAAAEKYLRDSEGYFIYRNECVVGIGVATENKVYALVSLIPGCGSDVLGALCKRLTSKSVVVEVASANVRAMRLYSRLGFTINGELSRWYTIY